MPQFGLLWVYLVAMAWSGSAAQGPALAKSNVCGVKTTLESIGPSKAFTFVLEANPGVGFSGSRGRLS